MINALIDGFTYLNSSMKLFFTGAFFTTLIVTLTEIGRDIFLWFIDISFAVLSAVLQSIGVIDEVMNLQNIINSIPIEVQQMMSTLQFDKCLFIVGSAYTTRTILRIIPFSGW